MSTTFMLILILCLPILGFAGLWVFFKKKKLHASAKYRAICIVAGNVLVLFTLVSMLLAAGELYLRLFCDTTDSYGLTQNHRRWFRRHAFGNEQGYRDTVPHYGAQNNSGKKRLVILGDSFTVGQGIADIEDTLGFRLRKKLPDWEVRIHAQCGWETDREIFELNLMIADSYEVDAILLVYCLNDIGPLDSEWLSIVESLKPGAYRPVYDLVKDSYALSYLYSRLIGLRYPALGQYFDFLRDAYDGRPWEGQRILLKDLAFHATQELNAQLLVCTFPFLQSLGSDYPVLHAHEKLDRLWTELNTPHLDLLPVYQKYRAEDLIVNRHDAHPNEFAIEIAADAIADFLRENARNPSTEATPNAGEVR